MMILSIITFIISFLLQGITSLYFYYGFEHLSWFFTIYPLISLLILVPYFESDRKRLIFVIVVGLLVDIIYANTFVFHVCVFLIIYYFSKFFHFFFPYNLFTINLSNLLSIFIYHIISFLFLFFVRYDHYNIFVLLRVMGHSIIMTFIYTSIVYLIVDSIFKRFHLKEIKQQLGDDVVEFSFRNPVIVLIGGKARSGKSTVGSYFKDVFEDRGGKVIFSPYTKYLKQYIKEVTGEEVVEENKPRDLLQKLSSELIKKTLGYEDLFIRRQIEDISIYSYFFDYIIIPDVRFPEEIERIKSQFPHVISIGVVREDYQSDLTEEQQNDITEVSLDGYQGFDYIISNHSYTDLKEEVLRIVKESFL